MEKYMFADWWERRGDPLACLDENYTDVRDVLEIVAQTEKAVKVKVVLCTRKQTVQNGTIDILWMPKSAFIYADFENFKKKDISKIQKRIAFIKKCGYNEYADELSTILQ